MPYEVGITDEWENHMETKLKQIMGYVQSNYGTLQKSNFAGEECVIIYTKHHEDYGWDNHRFEGLGVTVDGKLHWYFSSGCSCEGGASSIYATLKDFVVTESPYTDVVKEWFDGDTLTPPTIEGYDFQNY